MPVDIHGGIDLESPAGRSVRLAADGASLRLSVPDWRDLQSMGPRSLLAQRRALARAVQLTSLLNVGLAIDVRNQNVMRIGRGARTSLLVRLLGLRDASISLGNALRFMLRRSA